MFTEAGAGLCTGEADTATTQQLPGEIRGGGAGAGCDCVHGPQISSASAMLLTLALVALRRFAPVALAFLLQGSAFAQVDAQRFRVTDGGDMPLLWEGDLGPKWSGGATFSLNAGHTLAVLEGVDDPRVLLDRAWSWELAGSMNFGGISRVGIALPFHAVTFEGDRIDGLKRGDAVIWLSIPVSRAGAPTQAAWTVKINAPTGRPEWLLGDAGVVTGLFTARFPSGPVESTLNLGAAVQQDVPIPGASWGSHWVYGLGIRAEPAGPTWVTAELMGNAPVKFWGGAPAQYPTEVLLSGGVAATRLTSVGAGIGTGISRGLGASTFRVVALVDVRPRNQRDQDGDGIADLRDLCRRQPEDRDGFRDSDGCPDTDNDRDGLVDSRDECPDMAEVVNDHEDEDGCPDRIAALDVVVEAVPGLSEAEVHVGAGRPVVVFAGETLSRRLDLDSVTVAVAAPGFHPHESELALDAPSIRHVVRLEPLQFGTLELETVDPRGRPVVARAGADGAPPHDVEAAWTLLAGERQIRVVSEGFFPRTVNIQIPVDQRVTATVELRPTSIAMRGSELDIQQHIHFALDQATVSEDSLAVVDELAAWLAAHPEVRLLRIEGHADASGTSQHNYHLSMSRASAIANALTQRGIEAERLQPIGSGEANRSGGTDASDRRVSFTVLVWEEG